MTCCTGSCAAAGFFGPKIARWDLRRYQRRGPDRITRLLLAELRRWPIAGLQLLDVGSGIGTIAAELADDGLAGATLADASPAYMEVARHHLGPRYASRPVHFILGDFSVTGASLPDADIVTLDRVVCCYPDADALLRLAATRSRRLLALTYPRDKWFLRAAFILQNFGFRLTGSRFRAFVHSPQRMASVLEAAGFVRAAHHETLPWALDLYQKAA